jgi:hypothetical protein
LAWAVVVRPFGARFQVFRSSAAVNEASRRKVTPRRVGLLCGLSSLEVNKGVEVVMLRTAE